MPPTPRSVARNERYHIVVTIWRTQADRERDHDPIRAATGVMSRSGGQVSVSIQGVTRYYPPKLSPDTEISWGFDLTVPSVPIRFLWGREGQAPGQEWANAVGEVCVLDESGGGASVVAWGRRFVAVDGPATGWEWDRASGWVSCTIAGRPLEDSGDFYGAGDELSSRQFPDLDSTADRDRARNSAGLLWPIVYAPVDSNVLVPVPCVQDEEDAVYGVSSLVPRRFMLGRRRFCGGSSSPQKFLHPDPDQPMRALSRASSTYQKTPAQATDALGKPYWYVNGDFRPSFGSSSVTFTNGSSSFTATKTSNLCRVGWQVKASTADNTSYLVVGSKDGSAGELVDSAGTSQNYGAATSTNGDGHAIPLIEDGPDAMFWNPYLGGIAAGDGTPITNVVDVVADILHSSRLSVGIAYGDLAALRSKTRHQQITWATRERGEPKARAMALLALTTIQPYLSEGCLRFRWAGPVTSRDIVATFDLDSTQPIYRTESMTWLEEPVFPVVSLAYKWNIWTGTHQRSIALDGAQRVTSNTLARTGRALSAYRSWRATTPQRATDEVPTLDTETDMIETRMSAIQTAQNLQYSYGHRQQVTSCTGLASMRWLRPGDVIQLTQSYSTRSSQLWRVQRLHLDGRGRCRLMLKTAQT